MDDYLVLAIGFGLLILGGELLVRGAVAVATAFRLSPLLIGLTIVGFGTSSPELVTSLSAAFAGSPGIALGNVVGSNIANVMLILGVAALLSPIPVKRAPFLVDGGMATLAGLAGAVALLAGEVDRVAGIALLAALLIYLVASYRRDRREVLPDIGEETGLAPIAAAPPRAPLWRSAAILFAGLALTILGADQLVAAGRSLALEWGASEALIGLTVVAIGTSLPELTTSVVAGLRGHSDIALGNILGSNIFNIFGIMGVTAIAHPLTAPAELAAFDVWALLGASAALVLVAVTGWRVTRPEGGALLLGYAAYLALKAL